MPPGCSLPSIFQEVPAIRAGDRLVSDKAFPECDNPSYPWVATRDPVWQVRCLERCSHFSDEIAAAERSFIKTRGMIADVMKLRVDLRPAMSDRHAHPIAGGLNSRRVK